MSGGTQVSYEELLTAGAVLPPDTEEAGERAVPLTARAYRHPGLDDRVVVRLVAGELGAAEDLAAGFLGLEPAAQPAVVGLDYRAADRQSHSHPLRLGRIKGFKETVQTLRIQPRTRISYHHKRAV